MISDLFYMNGYGYYVLSSFLFTLFCFLGLYIITKIQLIKEQNKFNVKFGELNSEQVKEAKKQKIYKEIITTEIYSKI
jgi:heme exporter protein D